MKNNLAFFLILLISNNLIASDQLSCSANGLNVIYINGVNVEEIDNTKSKKNIILVMT